jgi:cobalt-zinc-cadmium efflux system membrane fusion protein
MRIEIFIEILIIVVIFSGCVRNLNDNNTIAHHNDSSFICSGYSYIESQGISEISSPIEGKIIFIETVTGKQVQPGQILAYIENTDFLLLQQQYLESKIFLEYFGEEYERQGDLTVENATSIKRMQAAKQDYLTAELKFHSLREQIKILGINPDSIKIENIRATLPIRSSIKGTVCETNISRGKYVYKGDKLFEIAEKQSLVLKLQLHENEIKYIRKDQKINFLSIADTNELNEAYIINEANTIDPLTHVATITALPAAENINLIPGMSVRAIIYTTHSKQ